MGFDLPVFISAGIQDALGPMQLATAGLYAVMLLFLRRTGSRALFISAGLFILVLLVLGVMFDLKLFDPVADAPGFFDQAAWVLLAFGSVFLAMGAFFLREWRILVSGPSRKFAAFIPTPAAGKPAAFALSFFLAGTCAFLANIWPVNYQVMIQGGMAFSPGRFLYSLGVICVYELLRNGAVLFVLVFFVLARGEKNAEALRRKRSLVSIIASAFYFAVGGTLYFFFFVAVTKPWL